MSQDYNCSNNSNLAERLQQFDQLIISFRSAQDLWQVTDIVGKISDFGYDEETVQALIKSGVLECVIKLLGPEYHQRERLIIHCSDLLINITRADGQEDEGLNYIISLGAIKRLIELLRHPNIEVKQNAVFLLANIAGGSFEHLDMMIEGDVVKHTEWLLKTAAPRPSLIKHVSKLLEQVLRVESDDGMEKVTPLIKYLAYFLNMRTEEIILNSLWTFSYLSGNDDRLQCIYNLNIGPRLIELIQHENDEIQTQAIETLCNMLLGPRDEVDKLVQQGCLEVLANLLSHETEILKTKICCNLAFVMHENSALVEQMVEFEDGKIIKSLMKIVETESNDLVSACLDCFKHASAVGDIQQIDNMVDFGVIEMLVSKLTFESGVEIITISIETLKNILDEYNDNPDFGDEGEDKVSEKLIECGGFTAIENLLGHPDKSVLEVLVQFITKYADTMIMMKMKIRMMMTNNYEQYDY